MYAVGMTQAGIDKGPMHVLWALKSSKAPRLLSQGIHDTSHHLTQCYIAGSQWE